jgi:hypothetical protein
MLLLFIRFNQDYVIIVWKCHFVNDNLSETKMMNITKKNELITSFIGVNSLTNYQGYDNYGLDLAGF